LFKRQAIAPGQTISFIEAGGDTGAGFTPKPELLFAEISEDFKAYALGNNHRHLAEMRAVMKSMNADNDLLFVPHLLPVARGILATITVVLSSRIDNPLRLWEEDYGEEPFIEVTKDTPSIRDVVRRNVVRVSAIAAEGIRQPTLTLTAAIDNLVKGAAGQAVQNAILMLGIPETTGLPV
jgi:N-acetyl-gamma-glutamyl-phosphate reductase